MNVNCHLLTCDGNIWPGLLFPPGGNKHGDVGVASVQEEVHGEPDSQTRENFLVPVAALLNGIQGKFMT